MLDSIKVKMSGSGRKKKVNRKTCIQHFLINCVTRIEFVKVSRTKKRAAFANFFAN